MPADPNASVALPRPRLIGRLVRLVLGAILLYFFVKLLIAIPTQAHGFLATQAGWRIPGGDWWLVAIGCLFALPLLINSGFGRRWGNWPRIALLALAGVAALADWLVYGAFWAWPLAALVFLLIAYVLFHAGISYLVAAFAATPG
jgi:hypothetical protein